MLCFLRPASSIFALFIIAGSLATAISTTEVTFDDGGAITRLTFVNVDTGNKISFRYDSLYSSFSHIHNIQIDLAELPVNASLSLLVDTTAQVERVSFTLYYDATYVVALAIANYTRAIIYVDTLPQPFALGGKKNTSKGLTFKPVPALITPGKYVLLATSSWGGTSEDFENYVNIEVLARSRVANYTLVDASNNASNNQAISPFLVPPFIPFADYLFGITPPSVIDYLLFSGTSSSPLSIRANTVGHVRSVEFILYKINTNANTTKSNATTTATRTLLFTILCNRPPFALGGVFHRRKYNSVPALQVAGEYMLQVTAYQGRSRGGGLAGSLQTINVLVYPIHILNFTVVNSLIGKDTDIFLVWYPNVICFSNNSPKDATYDIRANTGGHVGSVVFTLSSSNGTVISTHMDNTKPFTLGRPTNSSNQYGAVSDLLITGKSYTLTATPYSEPNQKGIVGQAFQKTFFVGCIP